MLTCYAALTALSVTRISGEQILRGLEKFKVDSFWAFYEREVPTPRNWTDSYVSRRFISDICKIQLADGLKLQTASTEEKVIQQNKRFRATRFQQRILILFARLRQLKIIFG